MTRNEREKLAALVKIPIPSEWGIAKLINGLANCLANGLERTLSAREKYFLDLACWNYREAIGECHDGIIPPSAPVFSHYGKRKGRKDQNEIWG